MAFYVTKIKIEINRCSKKYNKKFTCCFLGKRNCTKVDCRNAIFRKSTQKEIEKYENNSRTRRTL